MRNAIVERKTAETDVRVELTLCGAGKSSINTGCGFLDHMLTLFAAHGRFDLAVICRGDTQVDYHHSVEDVGIALGKAFKEALGDCAGIGRYGSMVLPMDEALVEVALDISGRSLYCTDLSLPTEKVGDFDTELVDEFLEAFCRNAGITLHILQLRGNNTHHIIEAAFKGLARAMKQAVAIQAGAEGQIPSTKGVLA